MAGQRIKSGAIQVDGLTELNKALRELEPSFRKELKGLNLRVAKLVTEQAMAAAYSIGGVAAHVAPSLKAKGMQQSAGVQLGDPAAAGAEFGSVRFKQFKPWKGNTSTAGYFLYPTIRGEASNIEGIYAKGVDVITKKAGLA